MRSLLSMTLLALAWHHIKIAVTAILAVAGAIGLIGSALVYLGSWVRVVSDLARRLRRPWATEDGPPRDPTLEQAQVLNAIHAYFLEHGKPVPFWLLDKLLDRQGVALRKHAESMPRGLLTPEVARRGGFFYNISRTS